MKKVLLGLGVVVVVGGLGATYYSGMQTETLLKGQLQALMSSPEFTQLREQGVKNLKVSLDNYKRGLFSSTADLKFSGEVVLPSKGNQYGGKAMTMPLRYQVGFNIFHGPYVFKRNTFAYGYAQLSFKVPKKYDKQAEMFLTPDSTKPELVIGSLVHFSKQTDLSINVPAFQLKGKMMPGKVDWQGFSSNWTISPTFNSIYGDTKMHGMDLDTPKGSAHIGTMDMVYNLFRGPYDIWLGDSTMDFPTMWVKERGRSLFELEDLSMRSQASAENNLISGLASARLKSVSVKGTKYGPGNVDFTVNNLDALSMSQLQAESNKMKAGHYTRAQKRALAVKVLPVVYKMLSKNTSFSLKDTYFMLPQGKVALALDVKFPQNVAANIQPQDYAKKLYVKGQLTMPVGMVENAMFSHVAKKMRQQQRKEQRLYQNQLNSSSASGEPPKALSHDELRAKGKEQTNAQLQAMVQAGFIKKSKDNYVLDYEVKEGKFLVNGKDLDVAKFLNISESRLSEHLLSVAAVAPVE